MKKVSTVQVIDSLAEITRHHDRELLEKSLTATLAEFIPAQEFRLYKVLGTDPEVQIALLTLARKGVTITDPTPGNHPVSPALSAAVAEAVESGSVVQIDDLRGHQMHLVYPVFDRENEIYGVLVQTAHRLHLDEQRFTHGLLRVYSNYLMLLEESQRDKLTQLLNRENLDREVTKIIIANAKRRRRQEEAPDARRASDEEKHWVMVADLDHFKRINDNFGHLYGDEVLILFARLLESAFREEDQVFRYGGEEFIVIFKTGSRNDARRVCERLRSTVEHHAFPKVGNITVSIGVVKISDQEGTPGVIDQADKALYFAKENGRNQVCFYKDLVERGIVSDTVIEQETGTVDFF